MKEYELYGGSRVSECVTTQEAVDIEDSEERSGDTTQRRINIVIESREDARKAASAKLDHLGSLLKLPTRIWDGFMEEEYSFGRKESVFKKWDVPDDYKDDQKNILEKMLYFGTPFIPRYHYPEKNDPLFSNSSQPYGFFCSIDRWKSFRRNVYIEFSGKRIKVPIISRSDKPYTVQKEYIEEEIDEFMTRGDKVPDLDMEMSVPYTLERAETDIINTDLR